MHRVRSVSRPCTHVDFLLSSAREDLALVGRPDPLRTLFSHLQDQAHRLDSGVPARAEPGRLGAEEGSMFNLCAFLAKN